MRNEHGDLSGKRLDVFWVRATLRLAAIYNVLFGLWAIFFPLAIFQWLEVEVPNYPSLWQCIGMIVGVYGIGYWIAARDPVRHWPIVLVGFLGKVFGPIGFVFTALRAELPWSWGFVLLTNDLIWWLPFASILYLVFREQTDPKVESKVQENWTDEQALRNVRDEKGRVLSEVFAKRKVLLVFVRHSGCTFCREALKQLQAIKPKLDKANILLAVVHLGPPGDPDDFFKRYQLGDDVIRISNPECTLFRAFGLMRGHFRQLFGWRVWLRGFQSAILAGNGFGKLVGDGFQMPGAFLLEDGKVVAEHRHKNAADEPDYWQIACKVS
jgi:peroxiredoxin